MWKPLTVSYVSLPGNIRFRIGSRMFPGGETYGSALRNVKNKKICTPNRTNLSLSFYLENKMLHSKRSTKKWSMNGFPPS